MAWVGGHVELKKRCKYERMAETCGQSYVHD